MKPLLLPGVVLQVVQICASERDDAIHLLEQTISKDPGFSARMISTANSPIFATGGSISSIKSAMMLLGLKGVRNLALSVGAGDLFRCGNKEDLARAQRWWKLSRASALCARNIAKTCRKPFGEEAYLAALLHATGKNQLLTSGTRPYSQAEELMSLGMNVADAERKVFGIDHCLLTMQAVKSWGLAEAIVSAVNYLTIPSPDDSHAPLRAVTALGIAIGAPEAKDGIPVLQEWTLKTLCLSQGDGLGLVEECQSTLATAVHKAA